MSVVGEPWKRFCRLVVLNWEEARVVVLSIVAFTSGDNSRVLLSTEEADGVALLATAGALIIVSSAGLAVMDRGRLVKAGQEVAAEHEHDVITDGSSGEKVATTVAPLTQQVAVF